MPAGSRAKTEDGDEFATVADVTLLDTGVNVVMQAVEPGPVMAAAGALNRIVTGIEGWESVTNAEAAVPGRARQDDDEFKRVYRARTAHSSVGPMDGLKGAIVEAGGMRSIIRDNPTNMPAVHQLWTLPAHAILAIVEGGMDGDIHRAVENHRGMGVATLTAVVGGPLPTGGIAGLTSPYNITWRGTMVTIPNATWTGAMDNTARAAVITAALDSDVIVAWTGHRFIGQYEWRPDDEGAAFGMGDLEVALGLNPNEVTMTLTADPVAIPSPGPFVRPIDRALTVSFTIDRRLGFPGDGLERVLSSVLARVGGMDAIADRDLTDDARESIRETLTLIGAPEGYAIGEQVWSNDLLGAAERVPGTRVTALTVQSGGADASGVAVDLANRWTLEAADLTITVA